MRVSHSGGLPRILVLDLLESYARERDVHVRLERLSAQDRWICELRSDDAAESVRCTGGTAREAIMDALRHEGVEVPGI